MLEFIIEALYYRIEMLNEELNYLVWDHWEMQSPAFNHGQLSIYNDNMVPVIFEWLDEAGNDWPWADADWYADSLFGAYDYEVAERAFSDVITSPVGQMWDIIYRAQALQEQAWYLESIAVF